MARETNEGNETLPKWLQDIGCGKFESSFNQNDIKTVSDLINKIKKRSDLQNVKDLKGGHKIKIWKKIVETKVKMQT